MERASIIIGMGEVGKALQDVLTGHYTLICKDVQPISIPPETQIDVMHVCIRFSEDFEKIVANYARLYKPAFINICTTVPPGTTRQFGEKAVHSTTRGLHPHLADGLRKIVKHIGGAASEQIAAYFFKAGVPCHTHNTPETTELGHILNNAAYGVNLMFADEMARICREFGVDYYEAVMIYTQTNNIGFEALGHKSKARMILTPPNGKIGGHCVVHSANLVPEEKRGKLLDMLAKYNEDKEKGK